MVKTNGTGRDTETNSKTSFVGVKDIGDYKDTSAKNTSIKPEFKTVAHHRERGDCWCAKNTSIKPEFKTVGEASLVLSEGDHGTHTIHDQAKESYKNIDKNFNEIVDKHIKLYDKDFFVIKFSRRDKLMWNVVVNSYSCHKDCPFPSFNQTVWRYYRSSGTAKEVWVLPSEFDCIEMEYNRDLSVPWEWEQLDYVIKFWDGSLKALALKESASLNLKEKW